jgi:hypothetical protein
MAYVCAYRKTIHLLVVVLFVGSAEPTQHAEEACSSVHTHLYSTQGPAHGQCSSAYYIRNAGGASGQCSRVWDCIVSSLLLGLCVNELLNVYV